MANHTTSHPHSNPSVPKSGLFDSLEGGPFIDWLTQYGKTIVYALIAFIALLIIVYRFSSSHNSQLEQDYLQANKDFSLITKANTPTDSAAYTDALKSLQLLMDKHTDLQAAYDGSLAQTFLNQNNLSEATPYISRTLARTKSDDLPDYAEFAAITQFIAEKNYTEALSKALALQQQMYDKFSAITDPNQSYGHELFALNLYRIGMLQQQLGLKDAELNTWQQWQKYANPSSNNPTIEAQAFQIVNAFLTIESFTLSDYIAHRIKLLQGQ